MSVASKVAIWVAGKLAVPTSGLHTECGIHFLKLPGTDSYGIPWNHLVIDDREIRWLTPERHIIVATHHGVPNGDAVRAFVAAVTSIRTPPATGTEIQELRAANSRMRDALKRAHEAAAGGLLGGG